MVLTMFDSALEFGNYPINVSEPSEELEKKYEGYWREPLVAIREEGIA